MSNLISTDDRSRLRLIVRLPPSFGGTPIGDIIDVWREADIMLGVRNGSTRAGAFPIDGSHIEQHLADGEAVADFDTDAALLWVRTALDSGRHPLQSYLDIVVGRDVSRSDLGLAAIGRFLQQLFLAMNISLPGSCDLSGSRYKDITDPIFPPPQLDSGVLQSAALHADRDGWPRIERMPLNVVWTWLEGIQFHEVAVASNPLNKALFTVLLLSERRFAGPDDVLLVAQALEALFIDGADNTGNTLCRRVESLLGKPDRGRNWFAKFYALRSAFAHGSLPIPRPSYLYDMGQNPEYEEAMTSYWRPVDQAIAVLLSVIQDLARSGAHGYSFVETVERR